MYRADLKLKIERAGPDRNLFSILCRVDGTRTIVAAAIFARVDYTNLTSIHDGLAQWKDNGLGSW